MDRCPGRRPSQTRAASEAVSPQTGGDDGGGGKGGTPDAKIVGEAGDGGSGSPGNVAKIQGILAKVHLGTFILVGK